MQITFIIIHIKSVVPLIQACLIFDQQIHICTNYTGADSNQAPANKSIHAIKIFTVITLKSNISSHWHIAANLVINPTTDCVVLLEIPLPIKWLSSWLFVASTHDDRTDHFLKPYTCGSSPFLPYTVLLYLCILLSI